MRIELHCHSICSDGELAPEIVGKRAKEREVDLFCLTDHDTCAGSDLANEQVDPGKVLRGVEMTCHHNDGAVHLLVYKVDSVGNWEEFETFLSTRSEKRRDRIREMAAKLSELGIAVDCELVLSHTGTIGRPHLAREMVRVGAVKTTAEAFHRYIGDDGPAFVQSSELSVEDGLERARYAGGRVSLAHPHSRDDAVDILQGFREQGLSAVEAFYGPYKKGRRRNWLRVAEDLGLAATGGSDFHSDSVPKGARLGVDIPAIWAQRLTIWLNRPAHQD